MTGEPSATSRASIAAAALALVLGAALSAATPAAAQPSSLRQGLFGRPSEGRQFRPPPVARYVAEDGSGFILDRTQPKPLLKFDNSPELWVLHPQPGPRGDVIYKNEVGEPVLRATRLGGVTVFTDARPSGAAAALAGDGPPLRLSVLSPQELLVRLAQAGLRASRAARHGVSFEAEASPNSSAVIADAATVASVAIIRISGQPEGRRWLNRLRRVLLIEGRRPAAQMQQETLVITVVGGQGPAGRPSSDRIVAVANGR